MQVNEYQKAAMATLNPALDKKDVLINSVMGLCGESGEAIDIVKKWLMQGHELDREHLVRELGDVAWYLAEAATALDKSQGGRFINAGFRRISQPRRPVAQGAERAGNQGAEAVYTDNAGERAEVRELLYLTAVVQDAALPAASIEKTILPHALRPSP